METPTVAIDTGHAEMIHDAQLDFYGKRLATASSDRTIKVFEVVNDDHNLLATITGHDGPVWQVAWSHPQFGNLLASCSYDRRVFVWRNDRGRWDKVFENPPQSHGGSINSIAWAPHDLGLILACGCADGNIYVYTYSPTEKVWTEAHFLAHPGGVNSLSWSPSTPKGGLVSGQAAAQGPVKRLVSGGCDNLVRIWSFGEQGWTEQKAIEAKEAHHSDWVRDVAWAPSVGLPRNTIASCSEDKTVAIWCEEPNGTWRKAKTLQFDHKVWRVSWSIMGNILAVSQGDNNVSLWKEALNGEWENVKSVSEGDVDAVESKKPSPQ